MFTVIMVQEKQEDLITRIVVGCRTPAEMLNDKLKEHGFHTHMDDVEAAPERDEAERKRADNLVHILMEPSKGNA